MTLDTRVYVNSECDGREVFHVAQGMLSQYDGHRRPVADQRWDDRQDSAWRSGQEVADPSKPWTIANAPMQDLPAWLMVHYRPGAPLRSPEDVARCDEDCGGDCSKQYHPQACWVEVSMDTAYGYSDAAGRGCGDLHALLVAELGQWLTGAGLSWRWRNEFTGDVHDGPARLTDLISGGAEASGWFRESVLPAILADAAARGGGVR